MASSIGLLTRICTLLAGVAAAFAAQENSAPVYSTYLGEGARLTVSRTGPEYTTIGLDGSNLQRLQVMKDFETYDFSGIDGEAMLYQEGAPSLPRVSRFYRIPETGGVDLVVTASEFELVENYNALPYVMDGNEFRSDNRDPLIYGRDAWFPEQVVEMSEPMQMRDFRVVTVTMYPIQVNPVTRQARIYSNLQVEIVANGEPGINEIIAHRRPAKSWIPIYQDLIENLDENALDDATTTPGTYMIVSRDNATVNPWADSLALWKKRAGFDVIVSRNNGYSSATTLINAIRAAYSAAATTDSPLEFVCLMGDPAASFGLPIDGPSWSGNYDHSYALGNTGDDLEDIGVGRFCASSTAEFATIFSKVVNYERTPYMTDPTWFEKAFLYAGIARQLVSNYTTFKWFQQKLVQNTDIDSVYVLTHSSDAVDNNVITQQLNAGRGIFLWRGSWIGGMGTGVAASCNNGAKLPICLTVTCSTGDYDSGTSVSESWVLAGSSASPKGGVTGLGLATSSTHPPENLCVTGGLAYAIANLGIQHIGHCVNSAKAWLVPTFGNGSSSQLNFTRWFNLMGDPGLSIWTKTPQIIEVVYPGTLNVGARAYAVHVGDDVTGDPVAEAVVTAWKGTECYAKGLTDANGDVVLPINVTTAGTLLLTVTKRNVKPYLADIPCVTSDQMVAYASMTIDDDNSNGTVGNGDGVLNPGETVDLGIVLRNSGTSATATGVSAILSSSSDRVSVVSGTSSYANIAPGAEVMGSTAYRVTLDHGMQQNETVQLILTATASAVQTTSAIPIEAVAAKLDYVSHAFTGAFAPGSTNELTVTIKNNGTVALTGVTAHLVSGSPFVSAEVSDVTYPDIPVNQQATNTTNRFRLNANTLTFRGHQAPMTLVISGNGGFADTTYFTVFVGTATGTDPCGPDGYGYYAYDNVDVNYELHPTFSYVNISSGQGQNLNLADVGEQSDIGSQWSTTRVLTSPFQFYGVDYDTLTISSNGWIAFGNQGWATHFRNYPIPAQSSAVSMIAPYWDDLKTSGTNLGVWYFNDVANDRVIVQWKAQGGGFSYSEANLDFEVILYGQTLNPTLDGNGRILIQYNDVSMNLSSTGGSEISGCSVGIQDFDQTTGLQIAYRSTYSPGASNIVDGRAILITTDARELFGTVEGTVTDEETGLPMQDARVTADGFNYNAMTDANGTYTLNNVLIGSYTIRAHKNGFNDATVSDVLVELDSTETVNLTMLHPEFQLSENELTIGYPVQNAASLAIINDGNGPLDYTSRFVYVKNGEEVTDWSALERLAITDSTADLQMLGCEFAGDLWIVSGGAGPTGTNWLYTFDRDGNYVGAMPQPSTSPFGWYDLAWDGQYIYGSEDGTGTITGMDIRNGNVVAQIPSPLNPTRALAYDPGMDRFWVADYTQNIFQIDRDGNIFSQVLNDGANELAITGLGWWAEDPDGYKLYIFSRDGGTNQTRVTKMHPVTYTRETVAVLEGSEYIAGGCTVTDRYNDMLVTFGAILQSNTGDKLGIYSMKFKHDWAVIAPAAGTIEGGQQREVTLTADLTGFRTATHDLMLSFTNEVLATTIDVPVTINITGSAIDPRVEPIPSDYALHQNYPNPFNPSTTIVYDLRASGYTKLAVYDVTGREVAVLVDGVQQAGAHTARFDGAGLASGVYFYRLQSGDFTRTAKMVLLK